MQAGKKTETAALSRGQFEWLNKFINRQREACDWLEQMHELSMAHMWKHLPITTLRKLLSKNALAFSKRHRYQDA